MNTNGDPTIKSGRQSGRRKLQRILQQGRQRSHRKSYRIEAGYHLVGYQYAGHEWHQSRTRNSSNLTGNEDRVLDGSRRTLDAALDPAVGAWVRAQIRRWH